MCFLIGVTGKGFSKTGEALLGSVSDNPYDVRTFLKVEKSHIGTELISTTEHSLTERGYFARPGETTRGVNKSGLAFTCAMILEDTSLPKPSEMIPFADVTTFIMQNCATVDEAVDVFTSKKAIHPPFSVLLADAEGGLVHLEAGSFGVEIYAQYSAENPGAVFAVNCYLSETRVNYNAPHTRLTNLENNNLARRQRGEEFAQAFKGELDVDLLARLLSDHVNQDRDPRDNPILTAWGYSICNHGTRKKKTYPHEDLPWGTVSAEILQPAQRLFWYCYGWPCGQAPEYGDQIHQEASWGRFLPFGLDGEKEGPLTTPLGEFTPIAETYTHSI